MLPRSFHSKRTYPARRGCVEVRFELSRKCPRTHGNEGRQFGDSEFTCEMRFDVGRQTTHAYVTQRCLLCKQGAVLRLTAGPTQEEHEFTSDGRRHIMPQVFSNERQCQIDAGADTRGRVEFPIFDKNRIPFNFQILVALDQQIDVSPMRRYSSSVKQSCGSKNELSSAFIRA